MKDGFDVTSRLSSSVNERSSIMSFQQCCLAPCGVILDENKEVCNLKRLGCFVAEGNRVHDVTSSYPNTM